MRKSLRPAGTVERNPVRSADSPMTFLDGVAKEAAGFFPNKSRRPAGCQSLADPAIRLQHKSVDGMLSVVAAGLPGLPRGGPGKHTAGLRKKHSREGLNEHEGRRR